VNELLIVDPVKESIRSFYLAQHIYREQGVIQCCDLSVDALTAEIDWA